MAILDPHGLLSFVFDDWRLQRSIGRKRDPVSCWMRSASKSEKSVRARQDYASMTGDDGRERNPLLLSIWSCRLPLASAEAGCW